MRNSRVDAAIAAHLAVSPVRAKSLLITIYGDSIAPHGGRAWLGGLIRLVAPFGINERSVRTTVFRLSGEGWLAGGQIGRRSHYGLTEIGRRRFEAAFRKIYAAASPPWNGQWCLVLESPELPRDKRKALHLELGWLGFGRFGSGLLAHPAIDDDSVSIALRDLGVRAHLVVIRGDLTDSSATRALSALVSEAWDLSQLDADYRVFLERFRPILEALGGDRDLDPEQCFIVRTLLTHEYRRVMLRDPQLPDALLPQGWSGSAARHLTRELYRLTQRGAESHLRATLDTPEGPLPPAATYFYMRFGGID